MRASGALADLGAVWLNYPCVAPLFEKIPVTDMSRLEKYLTEDIAAFEGALFPDTWVVLDKLNELQNDEGIDAPVAEIGVHHGKFIIALMLMKQSPRKSLAIDVFGQQEFNIDRSGHGDYEQFFDNIEKFVGSRDAVDAITADSLSLGLTDVADIIKKYGRFSFFSVDGCHTAEHTAHDLSLAVELTCHGGIIMIDDYHNSGFPGVQEGVCKYFFTNTHRFAPLLFMRGKLFLTSLGHHKKYLHEIKQHLREHYASGKIKRVPRFGYDTVTVIPPRPARS